jgi:hypothetical protein
MAYVFQTVSVNQILTAAIYNQTEQNIRDHDHGVGGVLALTATTDAVAVLDRVTATTSVVSTAAETTAYSKSILGGTLGTNRALRLIIAGDFLNNTGADRNVTYRCYYGAVQAADEFFSFAFSGIPTGASRRGFRIVAIVYAKGATNAQIGEGLFWDFGPGSAGGTAVANTSYANALDNGMSKDSTVAQNLIVTFQNSVNDAQLETRLLTARLEVLR